MRLFVFALLVGALAGCGASVDENKNVLTNRVWFDQAGVAHCPHADCLPMPYPDDKESKLNVLRPADADALKGEVKPHRNVCAKGHPVQWSSDEVVCWRCQGSRICPPCNGTGAVENGKPCASCLDVLPEDNDRVVSRGVCTECSDWAGSPNKPAHVGTGLVRLGGTVPRPF